MSHANTHRYDFCADFEFPEVPRTRRLLRTEAEKAGLCIDIVSVTKAGSVAMRQFRVCVDFRVSSNLTSTPLEFTGDDAPARAT